MLKLPVRTHFASDIAAWKATKEVVFVVDIVVVVAAECRCECECECFATLALKCKRAPLDATIDTRWTKWPIPRWIAYQHTAIASKLEWQHWPRRMTLTLTLTLTRRSWTSQKIHFFVGAPSPPPCLHCCQS